MGARINRRNISTANKTFCANFLWKHWPRSFIYDSGRLSNSSSTQHTSLPSRRCSAGRHGYCDWASHHGRMHLGLLAIPIRKVTACPINVHACKVIVISISESRNVYSFLYLQSKYCNKKRSSYGFNIRQHHRPEGASERNGVLRTEQLCGCGDRTAVQLLNDLTRIINSQPASPPALRNNFLIKAFP